MSARRHVATAALAVALFAGTVEAALRIGLRLPSVRAALDRRTETGSLLVRAAELSYLGQEHPGPFALTPHPALGWTMAPGQWTDDDGVTTTVDDQGHRFVPSPERSATPAARVVGLGDSFAFGHEVDDEDTWAAELQRRRPDLDVEVLAANGWGHVQNLLALRQLDGPPPAAIVLLLNSIDVLRNSERFNVWWTPRARFVGTPPSLVIDPVPLGSREAHIDHVLGRPLLLQVPSLVRDLVSPTPDAVSGDVTLAVLEAIAEEARRLGAPLIVVDTPVHEGEFSRLDQDPLPPPGARSVPTDRFWAPLCATEGVQCVDAWPAFVPLRRDGVALIRVSHWTAPGQRAVGAVVANVLDEVVPADAADAVDAVDAP